MIETIEYKGNTYPKFQSEGFAAKFAFPFAKELCKGVGVDVGCNREEWKLEGAIAVDPAIEGCPYDAMNLPEQQLDFCFSSHMIEHIGDWVGALDYWATKLVKGGNLFLYLPNTNDQVYWRPTNNRKHIHYMNPEIIKMYFDDRTHLWSNVMVTGSDLNCSFYAVAQRC
jgi:SAM-dependent methyltransferase